MRRFAITEMKKGRKPSASSLIISPPAYWSGGLPEVEQGFMSSPTVAAESTRTTPVSSMQYAAVPVDNEIGAAVTENPVSPEAPQAAGIPVVRAAIPLFANVNMYPLFVAGSFPNTSSINSAAAQVPAAPAAPPNWACVRVKPSLYVDANVSSAEEIVRSVPTAADWFAAILARSRFGIAIAAMIKMIATTINNSINEKPFCLLFIGSSLLWNQCLNWSSRLVAQTLVGHMTKDKSKERSIWAPLFSF